MLPIGKVGLEQSLIGENGFKDRTLCTRSIGSGDF